MIDRLEELLRRVQRRAARAAELRAAGRDRGGCAAARRAHVCRRAEREVLLGSQEVELNPLVLVYLNRLSDLLFILARLRERRRRRRRAAVEAWELALALIGSFVAGYVGSMLGLVLGTLRLPLIVALAAARSRPPGRTSRSPRRRPASGALRHAREGRVDWRVVAWMAPPSIVGAVVGRRARRRRLGAPALRRDRGRPRLERDRPRAAARCSRGCGSGSGSRRPSLGGFGIGALGGAVGVILGTLRMPTLVRGGRDGRQARRRDEPRRRLPARGRGLRGARRGSSAIDWPMLLAGLAGAMPGGWLGARATGRLDENVLRIGARRRPRRRRRRRSPCRRWSSASAERPTRCGSRGSAVLASPSGEGSRTRRPA